MHPVETLLHKLANVLNRNIREMTPARELCEQLDGKTIAIRVRDTSLAMYFQFDAETVTLTSEFASDPDLLIEGSILTLGSLLGPGGGNAASGAGSVRDGALTMTGDVQTAQTFQELLSYAKPDMEEQLSTVVGDVAAHRMGEFVRGVVNWARGARSTMGSNIREYLQEESGDLPSRYETERFSRQVDTLRDDVARLEARLDRLAEHD